jgi:hypothetical protein
MKGSPVRVRRRLWVFGGWLDLEDALRTHSCASLPDRDIGGLPVVGVVLRDESGVVTQARLLRVSKLFAASRMFIPLQINSETKVPEVAWAASLKPCGLSSGTPYAASPVLPVVACPSPALGCREHEPDRFGLRLRLG